MVPKDLEVKHHSGRCLSPVGFMHGLQAWGDPSSLAKRREIFLAPRTQASGGPQILRLVYSMALSCISGSYSSYEVFGFDMDIVSPRNIDTFTIRSEAQVLVQESLWVKERNLHKSPLAFFKNIFV